MVVWKMVSVLNEFLVKRFLGRMVYILVFFDDDVYEDRGVEGRRCSL